MKKCNIGVIILLEKNYNGGFMKIEIRYFSRGGNTKKFAKGIVKGR